MIGLSDIARLEEDTRALRETDYRSGGESCLDGVRLLIRESLPLLTSPATEQVRQRLHVALADLRNLAGWVCFDAGLVNNAHNHFCHALVLAGLARADGLTANVCYRLGRVFLHHGQLDEASRYFDLGRLAASRSGDDLAASILSVNAAWACAKKGAEHGARTLLDRGQEQFITANRTGVAGWAAFFTEADLSGMAGAVHTDLAGTAGRQYAASAVALLTTAIGGYGEGMVRSRALCLILLSTSQMIEGDVEVGVHTGLRALATSANVGSARMRDRFRPLAAHARKLRGHAGALALAERIDAGTATPVPPVP
ncbi:tetratricopeptide repeat protein [Lentzea sp. BCCO 10_0856]|uniref:Tetratricopeptide repeat protein n=1 Tax=Lentzea miocenica TaxID=3095431 RepID=A0ABU4T790_9PSEU|nr:tetratricopeptide repeat protein [Lentzea sp. BCCO 10_0856]MDX8034037.1 tetratricopeptide repeat protein [Lentzea sp. BCCO 10_0856]